LPSKTKTKRKSKAKAKPRTSAKPRKRRVRRKEPDPFDPQVLTDRWTDKLLEDQSWALRDPKTGKESIRPNNWMSQAGTECVRRLFYERTAQSHKEPFPEEALARMREGKRHEQATIQDLMALGYEWIGGQGYVYLNDIQLSGKREGYLKRGKHKILTEIKSMDSFSWGKYRTVDDLLNSKWYRGYPYQLNSYMVADDQERGLFVLRNKGSGRMRFLPMPRSVELWRDTKTRLTACNKAVDKGKAPERIDGNGRDQMCMDCPFRTHCGPDILSDSPGVALLAEGYEEAERKLERLIALGVFVAEHKVLNDWKKDRFRNVESVVVGKYLVTGKPSGKSWRVDIQDISDYKKE
jgi:hypothetical protein